MIQEKKSKLMQIKSVLEMHDFSGINRKVQLKKGNSSKALAETESEAEDTSKYFYGCVSEAQPSRKKFLSLLMMLPLISSKSCLPFP